MNLDAIHIFRISEESQNTRMYFDLEEKPDTEHNSVYMLRRSTGLGYATFSPPRVRYGENVTYTQPLYEFIIKTRNMEYYIQHVIRDCKY